MKTKNSFWLYSLIIMGLVSTFTNSCNKDDFNPLYMTDHDGNVYTSVTIGTQVWMVENLKTTRYSNGDLIGTTIPDTLDILGESTPKYQWACDGNESNVSTYGRLYTWYAVTDTRNVCPVGWHVPGDAEWTILTTYLGGESVAGDKLKETGTTHWSVPNEGATNSSGFTALPGRYRAYNGAFGTDGRWWSSTESEMETAYGRSMFHNGSNVDRAIQYKNYGFSVRCLKD